MKRWRTRAGRGPSELPSFRPSFLWASRTSRVNKQRPYQDRCHNPSCVKRPRSMGTRPLRRRAFMVNNGMREYSEGPRSPLRGPHLHLISCVAAPSRMLVPRKFSKSGSAVAHKNSGHTHHLANTFRMPNTDISNRLANRQWKA
jgi:hypothetical protein